MQGHLSEGKNLSTPMELKQKVAQLSALYTILSAVNSIFDRDDLLQYILQKTKELLSVEGASIILWDRMRDVLYFPVVAGKECRVEAQLKQISFPTDSGIAGWVFREGTPALVNDIISDARFYRHIDETTEFKTKSILCVPLKGTRGILGVLEAVNKIRGEFTEEDQQLLTAMADNISISIEKASLYTELQKAEAFLRRQNAELKRSVKRQYSLENIVGKGDKFLSCIKKAEQVAITDATVLIYGETGTGKDILAHAIHNSSPRASKNFVAINCGAIPENLLESELFGHEKGAFTAASNRRIGRFEEANDGTLFLDEIGDMPLNLQVKLLRVLQENTIQRLGSNLEIPVDIRLIAATNQNLEGLVEEGRFRQDLYYRLKVFELEVPPVRERTEDIPLLISHFITAYNKKFGKEVKWLDNAAQSLLYRYDYPGNVRQLEHIIERAIILCNGDMIRVSDLPPEIAGIGHSGKSSSPDNGCDFIPRNNEELKAAKAEARKRAEEKVELLFLKNILLSARGNVSEAARQANINRSWLAQIVGKYKLNLAQFRKGPSG